MLHIYYVYDIYNINMHIYIKREKNIDVKKEYWRQKKKIHILMQQCMSLIMTHIVKGCMGILKTIVYGLSDSEHF